MANNVWGYNPSVPATAIYLILFAIATAWHGYLTVRGKSWYWIPFVIGGSCKSLYPEILPSVSFFGSCANIGSPGHWLWCTDCWTQPRDLHPDLFRAKPNNPPRPGSLRRFDLHGPRPSDGLSSRATFKPYSPEVADQSFRGGRRTFVHGTVCRSVSIPRPVEAALPRSKLTSPQVAA